MLRAMFDRTFTAVYWVAATVAGGWLAWLCLANMTWLMAVLVFPVLLALAAAVFGPALAVCSAVLAGAATAVTAVARLIARRAA